MGKGVGVEVGDGTQPYLTRRRKHNSALGYGWFSGAIAAYLQS